MDAEEIEQQVREGLALAGVDLGELDPEERDRLFAALAVGAKTGTISPPRPAS